MITKLLGGSLAVVGALALFLYITLLGEQRHSAKLETRVVQIQSEYDAFAIGVKAKADEITRQAAQLALKIERNQTEISNEVSADYQQRLAALRAKYDRLRTQAGGADSSGAGSDHLPGPSDSPIGPDAAPEDYRFRCEADALQLEALQDWIRRQGMAPLISHPRPDQDPSNPQGSSAAVRPG